MRTQVLREVDRRVLACRLCPRLVDWCEKVAREKVRRHADEEYWGRPIPGFGDPRARLLLVGLAPGAHGANRTGRMFTGDESGNWLFRALHKAGFANQPHSTGRRDGLILSDCYITATLRCAPPRNRPLRQEIVNCRTYLLKEISLLRRVRVVVGLGRIGFDAALEAYRETGRILYRRRPPFVHGGVHELNGMVFLSSFHPSQQNTFTGRLTEPMFDRIFRIARRILREQ
jgi:uracil-DNA glycosylase family 4